MQIKGNPDLNTILCIDDDYDILALVQFSLENIGGFGVEICTSGKKAVAFAESICPDLILLDVMMPEMDGSLLLRSFKQHNQFADTPVIFMTSRVQPTELDKYTALGAAGTIPKPFNPLTLAQDVIALWKKYQEGVTEGKVGGLNELRQQYLKGLEGKRAVIEAFSRSLKLGKVSDADLQKMGILAHNLAGSGKTYGYHAISKAAKLMENMLGSAPQSPKLIALAAKLITALDKALTKPS